MGIGSQRKQNWRSVNRYTSSPNFGQSAVAFAVACGVGIAVGYDVRAAVLVLAVALVLITSASRLFTAVLLAALFLPFQRLLAADIGSFNLKISQVVFIIVIAKIFAGKLAAGDGRIKIAPYSRPVFVFYIANLVSVIWSPERSFGLALTMWALFSIFLSHSIVNIVITREQIEKLVRYMIYGGIIASVFGLYQFIAVYTGMPSFIRETYSAREGYIARVQSTALEPLHYASFLLSIIPLCLACYISKQRIISSRLLTAALILMLLNLVLTVSRGGYLGLIVASLIIWRYMGRESGDSRRFRSAFKLGIIAGCICLVLLAALSLGSVVSDTLYRGSSARVGSSMQRIAGYLIAWEMFKANPIQGAGIGSYGYYYYSTKDHGTTYVNNVPLEVAAETGLVGLVLLAWFGISILKMLALTVKRSEEPFEHAISVGLLASAAGLAFQYMTVSPLYAEWTWFAVGLGGALYNHTLSLQRSE